jgi:hypothetical protein
MDFCIQTSSSSASSNQTEKISLSRLNLHGLLSANSQATHKPDRDEVNPEGNVANLGEVAAIEVASN